MIERKCIICGKIFIPKSSRRSYCYDDHYHPCPVCGKPVLTKDLYHLDECCCPDHSRRKALESTRERFDEWPSSSPESCEKRKKTCLEKYGVDNPSKDPDIKKRVSEGLHRRYEIDLDDIKRRASETYFARTGYYHSSQNPEVVKKTRETMLKKYGVENAFQSKEIQQQIAQTNLDKFGTTIPMQNHEVWAKQRSKKSQYSGCDGTPLDSSYEVAVYDYCIRNDIPIKRTVPISYEYSGMCHKTFIDFEIDGLLVEVKGEHIMEGFFDWQEGAIPIEKKLEIYKENNVIVVTGKSASHHFIGSNGLKYEKSPLIGVDIDLFRNPEFPFRDDRPPCFYKVKVSKQMSSFDAFFDEKLRWQMIKNRINYAGGFISSKEILTALNVTRKCKQPSWFSESYAQYLLKKYSTSDIIVDPFAGWGTRHDAAVRLRRNYIGCDANLELVNWHIEKGRNIQFGDAKEFRYDGKCDVLICPPYKDVEVYIEGQDTELTQCQWLEIVRKNVPNAAKYIMVCKVVDPGYEKYIAEIKENKSHFGTNREYVLVIDSM